MAHRVSVPASSTSTVTTAERVPRRTTVATARAGNVIGGGDWAADRIVPDCVRALRENRAIPVRNKTATRPWQHVLEPLSGYLWLAAVLARPALGRHDLRRHTPAFNFGPGHESNRTVLELVTEVLKHWPGNWEDKSDPQAVHEAGLLQLTTDKANSLLGWSPVWHFADAIAHTTRWYREVRDGQDGARARELTAAQIHAYGARARAAGVAWARE